MGSRALEILEEEHHVIQQVVGIMAGLTEALEAGREVDGGTFRKLVEFMRGFADRCHHGKEEAHLFPALEAKGVPVSGCPLGILLHEHESGRRLVAELAEAVEAPAAAEASARERIDGSLRGLIELYPGHIWKEEYLLFPMAEKIMSAEELLELEVKFAKVEEEMGHEVHQRFEALVELLRETTQRM